MNKIPTKSEQIRIYARTSIKQKSRAAADRHTVPKMYSDVPKMDKKSRPDLRNPKRDIKMFKNGKIAERAFFGARNFKR